MLLKNVKIVNPKTNFEGISDIRIEDGIVREIAINLAPKSDEKVIDLTYEGAKYYNIPSGGQVSIPTDDVLSLLKSFNTYDVYKNPEEKYIVKKNEFLISWKKVYL